eukprot:3040332-Prorocentrum_lima.AAC.1
MRRRARTLRVGEFCTDTACCILVQASGPGVPSDAEKEQKCVSARVAVSYTHLTLPTICSV